MAHAKEEDRARGDDQCQALEAAGLRHILLRPSDDLYAARVNSWWSATSRLKPRCIIQPRTTEDVAKVIRALRDAGSGVFAVRSGGHSHWRGGSNIENGVTLDLGHMNSVTYDADTKLASLGPAGRWKDIYVALEAQGVMVAGGRDGNVGVGGFMTGGGNSFYTGRYGFACDNIVNAEVVLADGSIVNANADSHSDLWKALKGGSGNVGIVTRFDLSTFPSKDIWGGMRISPKTEANTLIEALINFTDRNCVHPETAFLLVFSYMPESGSDIVAGQMLVDTEGNERSAAFSEILKASVLVNDVKMRPMSDMTSAYALPEGEHNIWCTLTFKNDARVVRKAVELNEKLVSEIKEVVPAQEFNTKCLFQPIPKNFSEIGRSRGGNILGLDKVEGNALKWLLVVAGKTGDHEPFLQEKANAFVAELDSFAKSIDASVPWIYLNYADPSQDALKSYGEENVEFLRQVSKKYDPEGLFQKRMRSGFKISDVK